MPFIAVFGYIKIHRNYPQMPSYCAVLFGHIFIDDESSRFNILLWCPCNIQQCGSQSSNTAVYRQTNTPTIESNALMDSKSIIMKTKLIFISRDESSIQDRAPVHSGPVVS
jgi:hypothetical protein